MSLDLIESGSFASNDVMRRPTDQLRVVSWNIARGVRLEEIIEFLRATAADLICLQETDRNARRSGRRNVAAEIARALEMNYVFAVEFEELSEGSGESPAHHGQATFSRFPLVGSRVLRFRAQSRFWRPRWWIPNRAIFERRMGGRMALVNEVTVGDRRLFVYNLHLESRNNSVRRQQLMEVFDDARRDDYAATTIVAGDFNFDLTGSADAACVSAECFQNPFDGMERTTPSNHFGRRSAIDWILLRGPFHVVSMQVHTSVSASDHYPLSLTLALR